MQQASQQLPYTKITVPQTGNGFVGRYTVKIPISALLRRPDGGEVWVTIPAGAVLCDSLHGAGNPTEMLGVHWKKQYYSVFWNDLLNRAERASMG